MLIKTFRAKTIQEALEQVRDNLGPDACVLGTRQVRRRWIGGRLIEVDASDYAPAVEVAESVSTEVASRDKRQVNHLASDDNTSIASQLIEQELQHPAHTTDVRSQAADQANSPADSFHEYAESRNDSAAASTAQLFRSSAIREIWQTMIHEGFDPVLARQLILRTVQRCDDQYRHDGWMIRGQLTELVTERLQAAGRIEHLPHEQRLLAVVGPSGSGKSTLLGKLGLQASRELGQQVGIVSVDTWQKSGVGQLLEFAEQVSAEVEIVESLDHLPAALQRLREFDLVLLDSAGRSPHGQLELDELYQLLQVAQPTETHLVLPASVSQSSAQLCLDRFGPVGPTHLCLSKVDECCSLGQWFQPLSTSQQPVMYMTSSGQIDDHLQLTSPRHLAMAMLGRVLQPR